MLYMDPGKWLLFIGRTQVPKAQPEGERGNPSFRTHLSGPCKSCRRPFRSGLGWRSDFDIALERRPDHWPPTPNPLYNGVHFLEPRQPMCVNIESGIHMMALSGLLVV